MSDFWERHAGWWQEGFTDGADPEYVEQIAPLVAEKLRGYGRVLDLGCGEGQLARQTVAEGAGLVVGTDPTRNQLAEAARRAGGVVYAAGDAAALPFADASFDAVLACLVFEHIDRLEAAVEEVSRVLAPGGRFLLLLNHPLLQTPDSGWIDDQMLDPPEQYWRVGPYLVESHLVTEVTRGVHIPFVHRPLSRYVNTLVETGLVIERMVEPAPPAGFLARSPDYAAVATIPRLLVLVTRRV